MSSNLSDHNPIRRRQWVVVPKYQRQLATALAILQISTGLLYLGVIQFRVRDLAENARDLQGLLALNLWMEFLPWTLAISIALGALSWVMGLYFSNSIVGPIPRLRRFLNAVGEGDYSQRVKLRPGDAMEFLAEDLNQLAVNLEKRQAGAKAAPPSSPRFHSEHEPTELAV